MRTQKIRRPSWLPIIAVEFFTVALSIAYASPVPDYISFGKVTRCADGSHPWLGLSNKSPQKRFCFIIGDGPSLPPKGLLQFPIKGGFIQAEVRRDGPSHAALLLLPNGDCAYYTFNGKQSFLALADAAHPKTILYSPHGGIIVYGVFTKREFKKQGLLDSEMFMITTSDNPRMFLRIFGFIKAKMMISNQIRFRSQPTPKLDLSWPRPGGSYSMRVNFSPRADAVFPIQGVNLERRRRGKVEGVGWIYCRGIGDEKKGRHVVIHRVATIISHSRLPWKHATVSSILSDSMKSVYTNPKNVPFNNGYLVLRRRFIRWAITPGAASRARDKKR